MSRMDASLLLPSKASQAYFKPFVNCVHITPADLAPKGKRNTCYFSSLGSAVGTVNPRSWLKYLLGGTQFLSTQDFHVIELLFSS